MNHHGVKEKHQPLYQKLVLNMARNVNFDTMLPAVTFSAAGNIFILGGNTIPGMVTGQSHMVTRLRQW